MTTDLVVLCRTRPTLREGEPAGFVWDPVRNTGSFRGADIRLEEGEILLPDGTRLTAIVTMSFSHRSVDDGGTFALEALAERIARAGDGVRVDPQSGEDDPWLDACRRAREERYIRERQLSEEARARVALGARPATLEKLKAAWASVLLAPTSPEPDDVAARDAMAMIHTWAGRSSEGEHTFAAEFAPMVLALAREGARVAKGRRLEEVLARYGFDAARGTPAVRAELKGGGPLAQRIAALWDAHDALWATQRSWLRKQWPRVVADLLALAPAPADPTMLALRRSSKGWSDALADQILLACETRGPSSLAPFIEHLGLHEWDAGQVLERLRRKLPTG